MTIQSLLPAGPGDAAIWRGQAQRAWRGLTRAWHQACEQGLAEIPAHARDPLSSEFRHAVLAGLSDVPRIHGPKNSTAQHPGQDVLTVLRSMMTGTPWSPPIPATALP